MGTALNHDDLTRGNVLLADDGTVTVLDCAVANRFPRVQEMAVVAANLTHGSPGSHGRAGMAPSMSPSTSIASRRRRNSTAGAATCEKSSFPGETTLTGQPAATVPGWFRAGAGVTVTVTTVVVVVVVILVVAMLCGTRVVIETRRDRRRERRDEERLKASSGLPRGSRLTAIDPDGCTLVEIDPLPAPTPDARGKHGRR
ncbi:hypothetical protein [Amycolatopsis sp. NPDC004079]|uniref:hypothetical protein n=1 Tax=Amycolatopsis sp. NPDC004079 TaxID=3154549 RepID=UPI0033B21A98